MIAGNVFEIWRALEKRTPFAVQRTKSASCRYWVIEVEPVGRYGDAYGWPLPPPDNWPPNSHYGYPGRLGRVLSAGSYQWIYVPRAAHPSDWAPFTEVEVPPEAVQELLSRKGPPCAVCSVGAVTCREGAGPQRLGPRCCFACSHGGLI